MAKDLVDNAANNLLKEALTILEGEGSAEQKVEDAIDHLKLGFMARKLAAKRAGRKAEMKPAVTKTVTPTLAQTPITKPEPRVDTVVAAQANGKVEAEKPKSGMFR